jgi:hypothetical protein
MYSGKSNCKHNVEILFDFGKEIIKKTMVLFEYSTLSFVTNSITAEFTLK